MSLKVKKQNASVEGNSAKVTTIEVGNFFKETRKAYRILEQHEADQQKSIPLHEKIELVKEYQKKAENEEELDWLEKEEKKLIRQKRFQGEAHSITIPESYKNKVASNLRIETQRVNDELKKNYGVLSTFPDVKVSDLYLAASNITKLENMKSHYNEVFKRVLSDQVLYLKFGAGVKMNVPDDSKDKPDLTAKVEKIISQLTVVMSYLNDGRDE